MVAASSMNTGSRKINSSLKNGEFAWREYNGASVYRMLLPRSRGRAAARARTTLKAKRSSCTRFWHARSFRSFRTLRACFCSFMGIAAISSRMRCTAFSCAASAGMRLSSSPSSSESRARSPFMCAASSSGSATE
eukprot:1020898-Prymnesium_polylepis.1